MFWRHRTVQTNKQNVIKKKPLLGVRWTSCRWVRLLGCSWTLGGAAESSQEPPATPLRVWTQPGTLDKWRGSVSHLGRKTDEKMQESSVGKREIILVFLSGFFFSHSSNIQRQLLTQRTIFCPLPLSLQTFLLWMFPNWRATRQYNTRTPPSLKQH